MNDILSLQERLKKIAEARRLNAKIRESLKKRLQVVESQIYTKTSRPEPLESFYYDPPSLWGINYLEYTKLSQLFWGRTRKNPEDHVLYNKNDKTTISINDKRTIFLNQYRSGRQRALLITRDNQFPVIFSKQYPILPPICLRPYSIHDIIRCYILSMLYGQIFPISSIYPHISSLTMKRLIKNYANDNNKGIKLSSIGVDKEEMQEYITSVLMNLKQD